VYERYGPIPRICFGLAGEKRMISIYEDQLVRDPFEWSSLPKVMRDKCISEQFETSFASILMITPNDCRLPAVTFVSRHMAEMAEPVIGKQSTFLTLSSEPFTRRAARGWYKKEKLPKILAGSFSYDPSCQSLCSTPSVIEKPYMNGGNPAHRIPFSAVSQLEFRTAYIFERKDILSYDSIIFSDHTYTVLNGQTSLQYRKSFWLFKVIGALDSPIRLKELDELAGILPGTCQPTAIQGGWRLVFIIPNVIKDDFKTQPYLGVGKLDWVAKGLISQYVMGVDI